MLELILPETPSSNRYWRTFRGRQVISEQARAYRVQVRAAYLKQTGTLRTAYPTGEVAVILNWHRSARRGDTDNRIKQALDSLKGLAYKDDAQVKRLFIERHDDGRGEMRVQVMAA